jgi:hypothetical protein
LAGNACDLLTITAPARTIEELNSRITAVFTARVHPGETNASWIMHGLLDFLTDPDDRTASLLRQQYVFKVVPMLNPDGVINGNYRCSLAGCDLNRRWSGPDKATHPTIYHTKHMIKRLKKLPRVVGIVVDIHGHSLKQGVFFYGCVPEKKHVRPSSPPIYVAVPSYQPTSRQQSAHAGKDLEMSGTNDTETGTSGGESAAGRTAATVTHAAAEDTGPPPPQMGEQVPVTAHLPHALSRRYGLRDILSWRVNLFPRVCSYLSPLFTLDSCSFKMQRAKASTFRMVAFTELGIDTVFTLEASLAGKAPRHFGALDLMNIGRDLGRAIAVVQPSMNPSTSVSFVGTEMVAADCAGDAPASLWLGAVVQEMEQWRPHYVAADGESPSVLFTGTAVRILSEAGFAEVTVAADPHGGPELSDEDEDPDKVAAAAAAAGNAGINGIDASRVGGIASVGGPGDKRKSAPDRTRRRSLLERKSVSAELTVAAPSSGAAVSSAPTNKPPVSGRAAARSAVVVKRRTLGAIPISVPAAPSDAHSTTAQQRSMAPFDLALNVRQIGAVGPSLSTSARGGGVKDSDAVESTDAGISVRRSIVLPREIYQNH